MSDYPEHDKLRHVKDESQAIGEFLDFGGYVLAEWHDPTPRELTEGYKRQLAPTHQPISRILAEYFEIDENKIEQEKRQMLDKLRA